MSKSFDIKQLKSWKFADFFLDEQIADINFVFQDEDNDSTEKIPAHKLILAAGSPVFKTMFLGSLPEKRDIPIVDATAEGFRAFLQYFYLDEIKLTMENVKEVIYLANKYEVNKCLFPCGEFLRSEVPFSEICTSLDLAIKFGMDDLMKDCKTRIINNKGRTFDYDSFVQSSVDVVKFILNLEDMKKYPWNAFMGCYQWGRNAWKQQHGTEVEPKMAEIRTILNGVIELIEFGLMDPESISDLMADYSEFFCKSDLVMLNTILNAKFPRKLAGFSDIQCELLPRSTRTRISTDVITFKSSKKVFFIGFKRAQLKDLDPDPNPYVMYGFGSTVLIRKSSNINQIKDFILWQNPMEKLREENAFEERCAIAIEPNIKYELRTIYEGRFESKIIYKSNDFDLGNNTKLSIVAHSFISSLSFKCPAPTQCVANELPAPPESKKRRRVL